MTKHSMTIVEIIVAMVIIMILLGIVVGGANVASRTARNSRCQSQIQAIEIALGQYREYFGYYPESANDGVMEINADWWNSIATEMTDMDTDGDGITDLTARKSLLDNTQIQFAEHPTYKYVDPFGQPFYYQNPGSVNKESYDLWSKGRDQQHGEAGNNDDSAGATDDPGDAQTVSAKNSDDLRNWGR